MKIYIRYGLDADIRNPEKCDVEMGRLKFATDTKKLYCGNGTSNYVVQTELGQAYTATHTVGGIKSGDVLPATMELRDVILKLLEDDAGSTIQYTTMPTASSSNVGLIVQYIGTTTTDYTQGYFYKCVLDTSVEPNVYKWTESPTQKESEGYDPDGISLSLTDDNKMQIKDAGVTTQKLSNEVQTSISEKVVKNENITAGTKTKITYDTKGLVTGGADLAASDIPELAQSKITNLETDLSKKQETLQYTTMPTASASLIGKVYQYIGTTTASFTHNKWYECQESGWVEVLGASVSVFETQPTLEQIGDDEVFATPQSDDVSFAQMIFNTLHPVGEIRIQYGSTDNPNNLWTTQGITCTWEDCTDEFEERYLMASSTESVGTEIDAGLPNIKGELGVVGFTNDTDVVNTQNDAFYVRTRGQAISFGVAYGGGNSHVNHTKFNAGEGQYDKDGVKQTGDDIVYGKSNTVTPKTYTVKYWRRVS